MIWLFLTLWGLILGYAAGFFLRKWFPKTGWSIVGITALLTAAVIAGTAICWKGPQERDTEADYAVLLGCALENGQARPELIRRCETALSWMQAHPKQYLIVSGGDPGGQGVTEAAVMAAWLRNHGADEKWIMLEDQARNTRENIQFAKELAAEKQLETDTVLVITSEYHQTRAQYFARQNGQEAAGLSCTTPWWNHLTASVREVYSFVKAFAETR